MGAAQCIVGLWLLVCMRERLVGRGGAGDEPAAHERDGSDGGGS